MTRTRSYLFRLLRLRKRRLEVSEILLHLFKEVRPNERTCQKMV